jgi:hypothetical protein
VRELWRRICLPRSTMHREPAKSQALALAQAPHAITSLHPVTSSMGTLPFDGGTEADSGPDCNRTIAGPLGAKHAPVTQHRHLGRFVNLFVQ